VRTVVYARQSKDRLAGIDAQVKDCTSLCRARGWDVVDTITDNDMSASNGKYRPGYQRLLAMIKAREIDIVVVSHIDRLLRKLTDLEHLIDASVAADVKVAAVTGDIDLSNDAGRLVGRILAVIARGEVERKSARQQRANRQAAEAGKARKGTPRPFGWLDDRVRMHPQEGPAVADACRALLAGGTVSGICRVWTARGLRPVQSKTGVWTRSSVTAILRNPRIAKIATYRGAEVGEGEWEPLVAVETFQAVVRLLADPSRQRAKGVRTMLGGLARCRCGNHVTGSLNQLGQHIYRCNPSTRGDRVGPHTAVRCAPIDIWVGTAVVDRLSKDDAVDLLAPKGDPARARELHEEGQAIRERLKRLGPYFMAGKITEDDMVNGRAWGDARLAEIRDELADLGRESVLDWLIEAENIDAAWDGASTDRQRAVVSALMTVKLNPPGRGVRIMDLPKVVKISWL
jgi:site-specific DNA recombinase